MANLKQWLLEAAGDEEIEAVVIGDMGWGDGYNNEHVPTYNQQPKNVVLSWAVAESLLDYEFYNGYGAPECNAVYAWTKNKVIGISQYDGSTGYFFIPRNPVDCQPEMPGG